MYAQWPFFIVLIGLSAGMLLYKAALLHLPFLSRPWWHYRHTVMLLGAGSWMLIYREDWRWPMALLVFDYGLFLMLRRSVLPRWLAVSLTLLPLLVVKSGWLPSAGLLGLSFITFRAIDALLMSTAEDPGDPGEYFLYLFFPPAILAGPMYRWRSYREDMAGAFDRLTAQVVLEGWEHLLLGIVQKFAIAQLIDVFVMQRLDPTDYSPDGMVMNAAGYSVFLYFDFAGYSNMAIGAAALFGFRLPANFNNPIATRNPQDFWKRWHVSLSEWLRDVVFSPLYKFLVSRGGMAQRKLQAQNICILATLFIMGTWNGFQPQYICSGLMFGLYAVVYHTLAFVARTHADLHRIMERPYVRAIGRVLTVILMVLALYVFSGRSPIH
ncbi:MAG: MBOAT family O-acyltransferase [Bacillota bacterium]